MRKKIFILVLLFIFTFLFACKNDFDIIPDGYVRLTGTFNSGSNAFNFLKKIEKLFLITINAFDTKSLSKVMVFTDFDEFNIKEITDNSFSIDFKRDKPIGLIFLDKDNGYLGYLSLGKLDLVPINSISSSINQIDFGVLSSSSQIVTPGNNPLDTLDNLSEDEIEAMKFMSSLFVSIIKNPDVDNDGKLDFFEKDYEKFRLSIIYYVNAGSFNGNLTPQISNTNTLINSYKLVFNAFDISGRPDSVNFIAPVGSSLNNIQSTKKKDYPDINISSFYSPVDSNNKIPLEGIYIVNYKNKTLKFNISNQSFANNFIIIPIPTITLNPDNTIKKINWIYKNSNNNNINNPSSLIKDIQVQIDDINNKRIYDSKLYSGNDFEDILNIDINWDNVKYIYFGYNDIFGNYYTITWNK